MNRERSKALIVSISLALIVCTAMCIIPFLSFPVSKADSAILSSGDAVVSLSDNETSSGDMVSFSDTSSVASTTDAAVTTQTTAASTTAASATTEASTTAKTTASTTAITADERKNAQYVVNPNYESEYYIVVFAGDSQSVAVYSKDSTGAYNVLHKCFTCSTGAKNSPTRTGQYRIRAKYRWRLLVGNVYGQYSSSISSSYLFHSVPYLKQDPSALDMVEYDKLGTPASHGCIRLCVRDSKWIYDNCPIGTQVNIVNKSGPKGDDYPARNTDSIYKGWDPSDTNPNSPYIRTPITTTTTTVPTTTTTTVAPTETTQSPSGTAASETTTATSQVTETTPAPVTEATAVPSVPEDDPISES